MQNESPVGTRSVRAIILIENDLNLATCDVQVEK